MKKLSMFLALGLLVFAAGCGDKKGGGQEQTASQSMKGTVAGDEGGMAQGLNDLSKAIASGKKMKCTYTYASPDGQNSKMVTYVEGSKYRSEFEMNAGKQISVSKDDVVYSWSEQAKRGMKMDIKCLEELNKEVPQAPEQEEQGAMPPTQDMEEMAKNAGQVECEPVSQIDFSVPQDVQFEDQCALMKKQMEAVKKMQGQVPNMPNMPNTP